MRARLLEESTVDYTNLERSNYSWNDHIARLLVTGATLAWLQPDTVCDPACGDGSVVEAAHRQRPIKRGWMGDLSEPNIRNLAVSFPHSKFAADAHETMLRCGLVDVIVLTEILEHVEDPDEMLRFAASHARMLVASSPIEEDLSVGNHEHLWTFDTEGYRQMLVEAGWKPQTLTELTFEERAFPYRFQVWTALNERSFDDRIG